MYIRFRESFKSLHCFVCIVVMSMSMLQYALDVDLIKTDTIQMRFIQTRAFDGVLVDYTAVFEGVRDYQLLANNPSISFVCFKANYNVKLLTLHFVALASFVIGVTLPVMLWFAYSDTDGLQV